LQRFENEGEKRGIGAYRTEFMRKDDTAGFSAHDLHESLARFWDVHVIGPHRLIEMEFADGKKWLLPELFRRQLYPEKTDVEEQLSEQRRQVADRIVDMDKRWQLFRRAVRGYQRCPYCAEKQHSG